MAIKTSFVLFRKSLQEEGEFDICKKYFTTIESRMEVPCDHLFDEITQFDFDTQLIIGRYSVLPYYQELEYDLKYIDCRLINSYNEHRWIADFEYYEELQDYTFKTWTDQDFYRCKGNGPFVVKGRTNSRKHRWNTQMFAENKKEALRVANELMSDTFIASQGILYREYVPLKTFEVGLNGLPFTNEWRLFFYKKDMLSFGYYWSIAEKTQDRKITVDCINKAKEIAQICSNYTNFFVLDMAETEDGNWVLVEVNDGQMSGLSENDPHVLYNNLKFLLTKE